MSEIRNVAVLSHSGAGKTSLVEAMLYRAGAIPSLGKVEDGSTASDNTPEEIGKRRGVAGLIFAYLGEGDPPEFELPRKAVFERPDALQFARLETWPCNWLQSKLSGMGSGSIQIGVGRWRICSGIDDEYPFLTNVFYPHRAYQNRD